MLTAKEEAILQSIKVPSEDDPSKPEFPPHAPKFPASPLRPLEIRGFDNVWVKDESVNPTGTHKDRMAWEIVVAYRNFLIGKKHGRVNQLPHFSLITNGTAGIAVQSMLKRYKLPHLKVLVDADLDERMMSALKTLGCEVYVTDLHRRAFESREILSLTHNREGFDITSNIGLDSSTRFYDWLSYEILNENPDYVFVPFGTGNLYENVLNVNRQEMSTNHRDHRFKGNPERLRDCQFIGVTTNNVKSKADKLFSPHLPFMHYDEQWIRFYKYSAFCGTQSRVELVKEDFLDQALDIAGEQGLQAEPSGIVGLAMMLQMKPKLPRKKKYIVVNTGKTKFPTE